MTREELIALAKQTAAAHHLDPALVCAVCEQESSWNPWALRYEPAFFAKYVAPLLTNGKVSATEAYARAFSWGLMQVMGQVAREHGSTSAHGSTLAHRDPERSRMGHHPERESRDGCSHTFLSELCDPAKGLEVGCSVLAHKLAAAEGNVAKALLLWNGGANPNYADEVLARTHKYRE